MTSITWAGPRCVQELGTILAPQNRIQGRCVYYVMMKIFTMLSLVTAPEKDIGRRVF